MTMRLLALILTSLWLGSTLAAAQSRCESDGNQVAMSESFETWLSQERGARNLGRVRSSPALNQVALRHACDMAQRGTLSHRGSGGSDLKSRLRQGGISISTAVENIARSSRASSAQTAAALWVGSPGHRSNLFHPDLTQMGLGVARAEGMTYYVYVAAKPR